jgi:membrane-associated phospholipid phosphatase
MKPLVPVLHPQLYDKDLHQLNLQLMGKGISFWQGKLLGHPQWTDFFCACYLAIFVWLFSLLIYHCWLRRALYQRFMLGLGLVYTGGFIGYLLYPAIGPRFAYPDEWIWLDGGPIYHFTQNVVMHLGARIDVFPSLHGALSAYLLFWQMRHDRQALIWGLPLAVGIWCSTLLLGFHYLPDLISGWLLALISTLLAPQLEIAAGAFRRALHPPRIWLLSLTEGYEEAHGKLAGRLSVLLPLGAETSPGLVCGGVTRARGEEALRQALKDMGDGPFWLRPSDQSGSKKSSLVSLKPLSLEQVVRTVFTAISDNKFFVVQKALKVSALGICRALPQKGLTLADVELRMTSVTTGSEMVMKLTPEQGLLNGLLDAPWKYFPKEFPLKGFELFEAVKLTRRMANHFKQYAEVEWVLSNGKVYVLDGRAVRDGDK